MNLNPLFDKVKNAVLSPRGRNIMVFMIFVVIASVLWVVMTLNEEVQKDVRCRLEIVNCPDSVTMVSYIPDGIDVNVKARGSQLIRYSMGDDPVLTIDYKYFVRGNTLALGSTEMRGVLRNLFGGSAQILAINPDTLCVKFTSRPPVRLPVVVESCIETAATAVMVDEPRAMIDSVSVYSVEPLKASIKSIKTAEIDISGLSETKMMRVKLVAPLGTRVVPDSVDVKIKIEKLVVTNATVNIEAVGVPTGEKLLLFPSQIDVSYLTPLVDYEQSNRGFRVVADYSGIQDNPGAKQVKLRVETLTGCHSRNIRLSRDSVSFMVER